MCRIYAYSGNFSESELRESLVAFARLSDEGCVPCGIPSGHRDGWGVYGSTGNEELFYKSTQPPTDTAIYEKIKPLMGGTGQMIAHLRKATSGRNALCNTHPFVRSGIAFCHNGSIKAFPETSFVQARHLREGHTDSETFFLRILDRLPAQQGDASLENVRTALLEEVEEIKKLSEWTSLTCLLQTSDGIVLHYLWNESHEKSQEMEF